MNTYKFFVNETIPAGGIEKSPASASAAQRSLDFVTYRTQVTDQPHTTDEKSE